VELIATCGYWALLLVVGAACGLLNALASSGSAISLPALLMLVPGHLLAQKIVFRPMAREIRFQPLHRRISRLMGQAIFDVTESMFVLSDLTVCLRGPIPNMWPVHGPVLLEH
jgi:hypothetical protein